MKTSEIKFNKVINASLGLVLLTLIGCGSEPVEKQRNIQVSPDSASSPKPTKTSEGAGASASNASSTRDEMNSMNQQINETNASNERMNLANLAMSAHRMKANADEAASDKQTQMLKLALAIGAPMKLMERFDPNQGGCPKTGPIESLFKEARTAADSALAPAAKPGATANASAGGAKPAQTNAQAAPEKPANTNITSAATR